MKAANVSLLIMVSDNDSASQSLVCVCFRSVPLEIDFYVHRVRGSFFYVNMYVVFSTTNHVCDHVRDTFVILSVSSCSLLWSKK